MVSLVLRTVKVIDLDVYALCFKAASASDSAVRLEECSRLIISLTGDAGTEDIDIWAARASYMYVYLDFRFALT